MDKTAEMRERMEEEKLAEKEEQEELGRELRGVGLRGRFEEENELEEDQSEVDNVLEEWEEEYDRDKRVGKKDGVRAVRLGNKMKSGQSAATGNAQRLRTHSHQSQSKFASELNPQKFATNKLRQVVGERTTASARQQR